MDYRSHLARLVASMSSPNREGGAADDLADGSEPSRVKMFVDGNLDKRLDKLQTQLEFVAEAFDGFDDLLPQFIRDVPLAAYATVTTDGEAVLDWLVRTQSLSVVQQDYVACQRARHAIENEARLKRREHTAFQRLSSNGRDDDLSMVPPDAALHLNPLRKWARFISTALLDEEDEPPCDVLFFPDGEDLASAVFELEGQVLINELADESPCTLAHWAAASQLADLADLEEFCLDLREMGLAAW